MTAELVNILIAALTGMGVWSLFQTIPVRVLWAAVVTNSVQDWIDCAECFGFWLMVMAYATTCFVGPHVLMPWGPFLGMWAVLTRILGDIRE